MIKEEVRTSRLRLILIDPGLARDIAEGRRSADWHADFPREDDLDAVSMVRPNDPWGPRLIVRASDGLVIGTIGFFGTPEAYPDGIPETEVGFGLVEQERGRGLATEALRALLEQADAAGVRIRAYAPPSNDASIRVLAKTGFTTLRGTTADGDFEMVRPVRS